VGAQRPRFELADIVRLHGDDYRREHRPSVAQERVLDRIATCRTAVRGGHVDECDSCGHLRISYNSCRDRHCPKCQAAERDRWLAERLQRLLPVPYFHVVFTIPDQLNPVALRNQRLLYGLLFKAASSTLLSLGRDPRRLGGKIGLSAVLHTWGQNLLLHPHLHCVVTGGALSPDGSRWLRARQRYLLPVKVLARLFRGRFLDALQQAYSHGRLDFAGSTSSLADPHQWARLRDQLYRTNWVVYAKPPFGGPEHVFRYLGRYTHRVAISNHRILDVDDGKVTFSVKNYADGGRRGKLTLAAVTFLRRFLLHVLPRGFVRIRHYGLCASRSVKTDLAAARSLLATPGQPLIMPSDESTLGSENSPESAKSHPSDCPHCGGHMMRRWTFLAGQAPPDLAQLARPPPPRQP